MKKKLISLLTAAALLLSPVLPAVAAEAVEPYGQPYVTSIVDGMVTADLPKPDLRDDFFLNVNYEWLRDTALPPDKARIGGLSDTEDLVNERMNALFTDESITGREAELVREFYQMCLDWESRARGREFLLKHLRPIQDIATLEDLTAYLTSEECTYYGYSMCQPTLETHLKKPGEWMVAVGWPTLSMWDSAEYAELTLFGATTGKFHDSSAYRVLQYAGFTEQQARDVVRRNYKYESLLAPAILTEEEQSASDAMERMFNVCTREELAALSPNFPILGILDSYGFDPKLDIVVLMPASLEKLNALYTEENVPLMRAYLLFQKTFFEMQFLDEANYREYQSLLTEYQGTAEVEADEDAARALTETYLSQFVDQMYLRKYTTEKTRENVIELMREIVSTYREMLSGETWLTEQTREKALRKLDAMALNAVRPDNWQDWSGFTFRTRAEGGSFLEAYSELRRCKMELKRRNSYGQPDPGVWSKDAAYSVNAQYDKPTNSINIYAGILSGNYYRDDMPREELLAGIGSVIAHEISHAFDTEGSRFDETGAFNDWWTEADRAAFDARAQKLIACFDSLRPWRDGSPYSGTLVQQEAIADLGSMACVLRIAEKTQGFDYDAFFRAFATLRRRKMTEITLEKNRVDPHPMDHLRVNVTLAQFPKFQQTYSIQPGDGMYVAPEDRIAVWGMD